MISNPNLIRYASIAQGTTILAEFTNEPNIEPLAFNCIEKTPRHHSMFSHTIRKRTYTFLINDPFAYFGIFDEALSKFDAIGFLNRVKCRYEEIIENESVSGLVNPTSYCFQTQFDPIFREILGLNLDLGAVNFLNGESKDVQNSSFDSTKVLTPLLETTSKGLKKKKRGAGESNGEGGKNRIVENKVDVNDDVNGGKDFSLVVQKNVSHPADRQKAKQIWRKHVWVVLLLDLTVCVVLFSIWLWVCRGFQCIES